MFKTVTLLAFFSIFGSTCFADTFTHRRTGEVLYGYAAGRTEEGKTNVYTQQKGWVNLNPAQWDIVTDRRGRNNRVIVLTLDGMLGYEIETEAFELALSSAAEKGPLFVLLELDSPGGRVDLAQRICAAITETRHCEVVAFVKGGKNGGALSAGAAVSLACDKVYMSPNTVVGAATMITADAETMSKAYGETIGEKFDSAWRAQLASLAEQNDRPGLIARAMVDKDIEVIEVLDGEQRFFVEPVNKKAKQQVVHTWSKKGSLLTLTAAEAVRCGVADGLAESRQELLRAMDAERVEIVINRDVQDAGAELKRARGQLGRIRKSVDLKVKQAQGTVSRAQALKILRGARSEFKTLIKLAGKYPDLGLERRLLEDELNSIEAAYERIKRDSRRR